MPVPVRHVDLIVAFFPLEILSKPRHIFGYGHTHYLLLDMSSSIMHGNETSVYKM